MATEYEYSGEKFIVTKPENYKMTVSRNNYTVLICCDGAGPGLYCLAFEDKRPIGSFKGAECALNAACKAIEEKLAPRLSEDELYSDLEALYGEISNPR